MARKRKKKSLEIYKTRFFRRRWFHVLLAGSFTLMIVGVVVAYFMLKGPSDRADEIYDKTLLEARETPSPILDRHGKEYSRIMVKDLRPVDIEEVPRHFINALVAAEDSRFFDHEGVDYKGVARAVWLNAKAGEVTQGASTITQQLARQSFDLKEKSIDRKLVEAFLARQIEKDYSKQEILGLYLNRIYFGSGFWGINAASLGYFGKPISEVDVLEAATLCGLIKSPNRLSPLNNPEGARGSRNNVLLRMYTEKMISKTDYDRLIAAPLVTAQERTGRKDGYVYEEIRQQVNKLIPLDSVASDGYKIYTTVDTKLQAVAEETLKRHLDAAEKNPNYRQPSETQTNQTYAEYLASLPKNPDENTQLPEPKYLQGSLLMIDNKTGGVIAMVGGRDFNHSVFNRAKLSRRAPGTVFSPLVYTAAFEKDYFPGSPLRDREIDNHKVGVGGNVGILGEWGSEVPESQNAYLGDIPARDALVKGKVTALARLGLKIGPERVIDLAKRAGVETELQDLPRMYLGESEVKLTEMCMAYSMFPNAGKRPKELFIVERIEDAQGNVIFDRKTESTAETVQATDEITAFQTHSCLKEVLTRGTGKRAFESYGLRDETAAGKTGTAYNFKDLWFVGYNSEITCGLWAGFDAPKTIYPGAFSNDILLPAWCDVMNASLSVFSPTEVPLPDNAITVEVCRRTGMRATDSCYDQVPNPDSELPLYERSTYKEIIRRGIKFNNFCNYHSDNPELYVQATLPELRREEQIARNISQPGASSVAAVIPKAPTIIGDDPYNSVQPVARATPVGLAGNKSGSVKRATRAAPIRIGGSGSSSVKLKAPEPIEFPELD